MAKRYRPIRIRQKDIEEYQRLKRNTRAKIRRVRQKYGIDLSGDIDLPPIESFQTRDEFNAWKERQRSFTNRANLRYQFEKNVHGVVASKALLREIEGKTKEAQRIYDEEMKRLNKLPFIQRGEIQGTAGERVRMLARPEIGGLSRPPDFDFSRVRTYPQLYHALERAERRADPVWYDRRKEIMKENFIEIIRVNLPNKHHPIIEELEKLPADAFYEIYKSVDEFDFARWDSDGSTYDSETVTELVNYYLTVIENFKNNRLNTDLWRF